MVVILNSSCMVLREEEALLRCEYSGGGVGSLRLGKAVVAPLSSTSGVTHGRTTAKQGPL